MGDKTHIRNHILEVAGVLFYEHGLRAIGIDRIIAEADISKATLYRHFRTKEQLIVTYLEGRSRKLVSELEAELQALPNDPYLRINKLFESLANVARQGFRGCAFIRAISEHLAADDIRFAVQQHKKAIHALLAKQLGPLSSSPAEHLLIFEGVYLLYEGALSTALVYKSDEGVLAAWAAAVRLLGIYE